MRNDFAIVKEQVKDKTLYLFVDTKKAMLRNMKWEQLGDWGKRKFANLVFLTKLKGNYVKIKYL